MLWSLANVSMSCVSLRLPMRLPHSDTWFNTKRAADTDTGVRGTPTRHSFPPGRSWLSSEAQSRSAATVLRLRRHGTPWVSVAWRCCQQMRRSYAHEVKLVNTIERFTRVDELMGAKLESKLFLVSRPRQRDGVVPHRLHLWRATASAAHPPVLKHTSACAAPTYRRELQRKVPKASDADDANTASGSQPVVDERRVHGRPSAQQWAGHARLQAFGNRKAEP